MNFILYTITALMYYSLFEEIYSLVRSIKTKSWYSCTGKLVKWNIYNEVDGEDSRLYIKNFLYKYSVAGKEYESRLIGFGFPQGVSLLYTENAINKALENAPNIKVHYQPDRPSNSVLITGVWAYHYFKIFMFVLISIVCTGFTIEL